MTLRTPTGVRACDIALCVRLSPRYRVGLTRGVAIAAAGARLLLAVARRGKFVQAIDRAVHAGWELAALAAALEAASASVASCPVDTANRTLASQFPV